MNDAPMDPIRELVEEYALGLLDAPERRAFEARLASDSELQRELAATLETLATLGLSTPAAPPPEVKSRVMAAIANAPNVAPAAPIPVPAKVLSIATPTRRSRAPIWLGAALAASLAIVAKLTVDLRDARATATTMQLAADAGRQSLAQRDSLIASLTDPGTEQVTLAATGEAKPVIRAFVNRARRTMMLSASQLETLPAGRAYQLWFIVDGKPIPSVTFRGDAAGRALLASVPMPAGAIAATAITEEPEAGSPGPTTKVQFLAKLATE